MDDVVGVRSLLWFVVGAVAAGLTVLVFMNAWQADAAPGESDSTFVPVAPCRLLDTRPEPLRVGPHGSLGADDTKVVTARGSCGVATDAVGVSLNVTALGATRPTFVTVWGDGARPDASSLNPAPGQPPTPNAVATPLSGSGSFQVFNLQGSLDLIVDVNGYYTKSSLAGLAADVVALQSQGVAQSVLDRLDALEAENDRLKALTASLSLESVDGQPTVRFTGVNVQVVDGSGQTEGAVNGRGNLIVGYNESDALDDRSGSHNLVVGTSHTYTSYGGFVAGLHNTVSGPYGAVSGGFGNTASGFNSSVSGGGENTASGDRALVSGGEANTAGGFNSSVSGGRLNTAGNSYASVSGGFGNTASGSGSSVSGGIDNTASGFYSSVSGGIDNTANDFYAAVSGGSDNVAGGESAAVSGGNANTATGTDSSVAGGISNEANGSNASVTGGADNIADGTSSSVSGGYGRTASGTDDWRAGSSFEDF